VNKRELVDAIASKLGPDASRKSVEDTLGAFTETVGQTLKKGDTVSLVGFGTFKTSKRAARTARNPQTGEPIKVAAATVPRFTPGQGLKDAVATGRGAKKADVRRRPTAKKAGAKKATAKKAGAKKTDVRRRPVRRNGEEGDGEEGRCEEGHGEEGRRQEGDEEALAGKRRSTVAS
jgi:DNA-binding protein HU-beta